MVKGKHFPTLNGRTHTRYVIDIPNSQSLANNMNTALTFRGQYNKLDVMKAAILLGPYVADNTIGDYGKSLYPNPKHPHRRYYPAGQNNLSLRYERRLGGNFNFGAMGAAMGQPLNGPLGLLEAGDLINMAGPKTLGQHHPQDEQDAIEDGYYYFYWTHPEYMKIDGVQLPSGYVANPGPNDSDPD